MINYSLSPRAVDPSKQDGEKRYYPNAQTAKNMQLDAFGNVQVKDFQYQLAIYIYEKGLAGGNFSRATAVGLFQSLVGLILVLASDRVAKKLGEDGLL